MNAKSEIRSLYESSVSMSKEQLSEEIQKLTEKRINEIRNTKTEVVICGKCFYVANEGSDENDGRTPETAWQTTKRVT